jgi:nitroreductase
MEAKQNLPFIGLCRLRQSCRAYDPERPVPPDALQRCLEAARLAPSACNSQPWEFIAVQQEPLRTRLADTAFSGPWAMNRFARSAPVLVAVLRHHSKAAARMGAQIRRVNYGLIDLGIAGEHFALQAAEEGLGTCWLGWFNGRGVRRVLDLPRRARVDLMFSLGCPLDAPREKKRKSLEEMSKTL